MPYACLMGIVFLKRIKFCFFKLKCLANGNSEFDLIYFWSILQKNKLFIINNIKF